MEGCMLRKIAFISCAIILSYSAVQTVVSADDITMDVASYSEVALLEKAKQQFKKALQANKDGHIDRVACTFRIHGNKPIETAVKTYFLDYHRKPNMRKKCSGLKLQADEVFELTYIKAKNIVTLVKKKRTSKAHRFKNHRAY